MNNGSEAGEHLKDVYLTKLKIDNLCNGLIKVICDEFPENERFLILGRVTNALIDKVYKPIVKMEENK